MKLNNYFLNPSTMIELLNQYQIQLNHNYHMQLFLSYKHSQGVYAN